MVEDEKVIKKFIIILVAVIVIVIGFYTFTKLVVNKDTANNNETTEETKIDTSVAIVGTMLKKSNDSYYVFLYDHNSDRANEFQGLYLTMTSSSTSKIYNVDLGSSFNSKYVDLDNPNPKASNLDELRFGEITLIKVEKGKITDAYTSIDSIKKLFKL